MSFGNGPVTTDTTNAGVGSAGAGADDIAVTSDGHADAAELGGGDGVAFPLAGDDGEGTGDPDHEEDEDDTPLAPDGRPYSALATMAPTTTTIGPGGKPASMPAGPAGAASAGSPIPAGGIRVTDRMREP
jgi:hypothetical protein